MAGSTAINQNGNFGAFMTPSLSNFPSSRTGAASWVDAKGNFWLTGGDGFSAGGSQGTMGDIWEYQRDSTNLTPTAVPVFSPAGGTFTNAPSVTITDATPSASIFYVIGNGIPQPYSAPLMLTSSTTVTAIAGGSGFVTSDPAHATFTVNLAPPPAPTIDPPAGTYTAPLDISMSDSVSNAEIYYTLDGTTPTSASAKYSGSLRLYGSKTVKAIAIANGGLVSSTATSSYTLQPTPANTWAFIIGSNIQDEPGVYGPLGVPVSAAIPGGRSYAASWTDSSGNEWIFGGQGTDSSGQNGLLNDLWKYDVDYAAPQDSQWEWVSGSSTLAPTGPRPGVYGTQGVPAAGNVPGGRSGATTWIDSQGLLWLFGGLGSDSSGNVISGLNDLWKFDPSSNEWTWISGSSSAARTGAAGVYGQPGVYGTLGTPASGNVPGGRESAVSWLDDSGNLWLFGGEGYDSNGKLGLLNDLWEFNPSSNLWAWMEGAMLSRTAAVRPVFAVSPGYTEHPEVLPLPIFQAGAFMLRHGRTHMECSGCLVAMASILRGIVPI